jgi:hypothetical protein
MATDKDNAEDDDCGYENPYDDHYRRFKSSELMSKRIRSIAE